MKTRHFRDLLVWQNGMDLARTIYKLTGGLPRDETFGLITQMRRAAVSIPSNIAEGHGRSTDRAFGVFLCQARGSIFEIETQLELAASLNYLPKKQAEELTERCEELARMINSLLNKLKEKSR